MAKAQLDEACRELADLLKKIEDYRIKSEAMWKNIEDLSKSRAENAAAIQNLTRNAMENSLAERMLSHAARRAIARITCLKDKQLGRATKHPTTSTIINSIDTTLPVWPEPTAALCGRVPADDAKPLLPGQLIAAHIPQSGGGPGSGEEEPWILAVVVRTEKDKCIVEDFVVDDEKAERHTLPVKSVVPLPLSSPAVCSADTLHAAGAPVLAMYPQTTCFYRATVHRLPEKPDGTYQLHFNDDDFEDGRVRYQDVPIKFVVQDQASKKRAREKD
eukprot:m.77686 g.77686  ORF g.77686 m.77686 type:complete len:274 (-) comp13220_c0_seq3:47-868(-)